REDVTPMKSLAHRLQVIVFDVRVTDDKAFRLAFIKNGQHAVVGCDEILILRADQQGTALRPHARVDYDYVDCFRRKVKISGADRQRRVKQVEWRNVVRDIHDGDIGIDFQDYALQRSDQMVVGAVVSRERDDRVGQGVLSPGKFAHGARAENGFTPHILTLAEARASVKNSRGGCCALANGPAGKPTAPAQLSPCSGAQGCHSGSGKCDLQNHKPHRSKKRWPGSSHGSSMRDTPWQSCPFVFTPAELMASSKSQKTILAEERRQRAGSTTPTLLTPLHAIYTRPSEVAVIFRTVPPPEGMLARAKLSVFGSNRTIVFGFTPDSLYQTIPSGVIVMPYGADFAPPGDAHIFTAPEAMSSRPRW